MEIKIIGLRVETLNVGTMIGRVELPDMMQRRNVDLLCVHETRWKGSKARSIEAQFNLHYHGVDRKRDGVGVILMEDYTNGVMNGVNLSNKLSVRWN